MQKRNANLQNPQGEIKHKFLIKGFQSLNFLKKKEYQEDCNGKNGTIFIYVAAK